MENPPPANPAAPESTTSPPAPPASTPVTAPAPDAPSAPTTAPPGRPPPDKVRTNLKIAGGVMVVIGALFAWQAFGAVSTLGHVLTEDEIASFADRPGGNITVTVAGAGADSPARVVVQDYNRTVLANHTTDSHGQVTFPAQHIATRLHVEWNGATWDRNVLAPVGFTLPVAVGTDQPQDLDSWVQPDRSLPLTISWAALVLGLLMIMAGVMAFRMRGHKVAVAGAVAFLAGALGLVALAYLGAGANIVVLLQPLLFVAMAAFCIWALRVGRDRFQPFRVGGLEL